MKIGVKVDVKKAAKALNKIHRVDVPISSFYARRTAIRNSMTAARKTLAGSLERPVPLKYLPIKRPGQKNTHARFIGYYGSKNKELAYIKFNSNHINPAGTNKYPRVATENKKLTKTGKKTKNWGSVKGIGGTYQKAFLVKNGRGARANPQVLTRIEGKAEQVVIELGTRAERIVSNVANRTFVIQYQKELNRQMKKKLSRYGTR